MIGKILGAIVGEKLAPRNSKAAGAHNERLWFLPGR